MKRAAGLSLAALGLLVPLLFLPRAEDAYRLVELCSLALVVAGLAFTLAFGGRGPEAGSRQSHLGIWLGMSFFGWRIFSHVLAGLDSQSPGWFAEQFLYAFLFFWSLSASSLRPPVPKLLFFVRLALALGSLYAVLQFYGFDPLSQGRVFDGRPYGTIGNPDFWGAFLVMATPLSLGLWLSSSQGSFVWVALPVVALLLTQSRGAWLGFAGGFAAFLWHLDRDKKLNYPRLAGLGWLALALVVLFSIPNPLNHAGLGTVRRLFSGFDPQQKGVRLFLDRAAWNLSLKHPVVGVGGGRFTEAFLEEQGRMLQVEPGKAVFTHDAHNDFLQLAAESGWPALGLFAALFLLASVRLWKRPDALSAGWLGGLVAVGLDALVNFPLAVVPVSALFWVGMGSAFAPALQPTSPPSPRRSMSDAISGKPPDNLPGGEGNAREKTRARKSRKVHQTAVIQPAAEISAAPRWRFSFFRAVLVVPAVVACFIFFHALVINTLLHQGMDFALGGQSAQSLEFLDKVTRLDPKEERAWYQLAQSAEKLGQPGQAATYYAGALRALPGDALAWEGLGLSQGQMGKYEAAAQACQMALKLDPSSPRAWGNLAKVHYLQGRKFQARLDYQAGLERNPDWADGWFNLGALDYNAGKKEAAAINFKKALALDPNLQEARDALDKMKSPDR
jgi:Tfp pilus assembly protein PilF/O-antigen ligase